MGSVTNPAVLPALAELKKLARSMKNNNTSKSVREAYEAVALDYGFSSWWEMKQALTASTKTATIAHAVVKTLSQADFDTCLKQASKSSPVILKNCLIDGVALEGEFRHFTFEKVIFRNSIFTEIGFEHCRISNLTFEGCRFLPVGDMFQASCLSFGEDVEVSGVYINDCDLSKVWRIVASGSQINGIKLNSGCLGNRGQWEQYFQNFQHSFLTNETGNQQEQRGGYLVGEASPKKALRFLCSPPTFVWASGQKAKASERGVFLNSGEAYLVEDASDGDSVSGYIKRSTLTWLRENGALKTDSYGGLKSRAIYQVDLKGAKKALEQLEKKEK